MMRDALLLLPLCSRAGEIELFVWPKKEVRRGSRFASCQTLLRPIAAWARGPRDVTWNRRISAAIPLFLPFPDEMISS